MHLKKYSYHTVALLLFCGCISESEYTSEEKKGYYTQNTYKLGALESFEKTIGLLSPSVITKFRKKLEERIPKWRASGTEKAPYKIWNDFFNKEMLENIVKKLEEQHDTTLLKNYYSRLGNLFKSPTEENEKEVIEAIKKLQADATLEQAFKMSIAERYHKPETIYLTESTLAYQELVCFILNKRNTLSIKLKKLQSNLAKWQEDGHPSGQHLWNTVQKKYGKLLKNFPLYAYRQNLKAIEQSLKLIDQLADNPYSLSYKDLLETLPHGIRLLNDILSEVGLEGKDDTDIKLLKTYLDLVSNIYIAYLD